jgi:hypothetical protein
MVSGDLLGTSAETNAKPQIKHEEILIGEQGSLSKMN